MKVGKKYLDEDEIGEVHAEIRNDRGRAEAERVAQRLVVALARQQRLHLLQIVFLFSIGDGRQRRVKTKELRIK